MSWVAQASAGAFTGCEKLGLYGNNVLAKLRKVQAATSPKLTTKTHGRKNQPSIWLLEGWLD
jgi:hypothetical protein